MARGRWASRSTFILAAVGSAVGLGNVWRFPYLTYEFGGGAFLIPYLLALFVIGIPLLIAEFGVGQLFQKAALGGFKKLHPRMKALGGFMLVNGFLVISYYAVVMAWSLLYLIKSPTVPWAGQSESFFFSNILQISGGAGEVGGLVWPVVLSLVAVWVLIYFCVWKGVRSVGKIVWWTVPLPLVLLVVLFIRGVTLPGFLGGWAAYLTPDFSALTNPSLWAAATSQIFFTLSLAFGIMIAYASFNDKKQNITGDGWITAIANSAISLFSGFVVFAILGYMATTNGVGVSDVVASGPGLAFVVFPEALSLLPAAGLFAALFFITLLSLGIDSAFSLVEAVTQGLRDTVKAKTEKISLYVCLAGLLVGLIYATNAGLYFLDIMDHFVTNIGLLLAGLLQAIVIGWMYGAKKLRKQIDAVSSLKLGGLWDVSIKFIIPVVLLVLLATQLYTEFTVPYEGYPMWALSIGWAAVVIPSLIMLVFMVKKPSTSKA